MIKVSTYGIVMCYSLRELKLTNLEHLVDLEP